MPTGEQYQEVALGIAGYLAGRQREDGGFPGPDHYGVASSLWLWSHFGEEFAPQMERARERLRRKPPDTHGEFNAYALLHCRERLGAAETDAVLRKIRFGRRHSANWMLLRAACAAAPGPYCSGVLCCLEARLALLVHSRRCFICDRPRVRSAAYHAFSGALLADIWGARQKGWAGRAALGAAEVTASLVLPGGDALYIGRGQQQIFGYGALLYLLEAAAEMSRREEFATQAGRVLEHLLEYRREDGSFPLVLCGGEEPEPWQPDPSRPGWYSYNRYADYLPFLGCFLMKAAAPGVGRFLGSPRFRRAPGLRAWGKGRYVAVLSVPGGATTNDLAFPYVSLDGESLFPCYGGEGSRVKPEAAPLPYAHPRGGRPYSFRERLSYRLTETGLVGTSDVVRHERSFVFGEKGFSCHDDITFRKGADFSSFVAANFLVRNLRHAGDGDFETWHGKARARLRLIPEGRVHPAAATTASGVLTALRHGRGEFHPRKGDTVSTELRVWFV